MSIGSELKKIAYQHKLEQLSAEEKKLGEYIINECTKKAKEGCICTYLLIEMSDISDSLRNILHAQGIETYPAQPWRAGTTFDWRK